MHIFVGYTNPLKFSTHDIPLHFSTMCGFRYPEMPDVWFVSTSDITGFDHTPSLKTHCCWLIPL